MGNTQVRQLAWLGRKNAWLAKCIRAVSETVEVIVIESLLDDPFPTMLPSIVSPRLHTLDAGEGNVCMKHFIVAAHPLLEVLAIGASELKHFAIAGECCKIRKLVVNVKAMGKDVPTAVDWEMLSSRAFLPHLQDLDICCTRPRKVHL